MSTGPLDRSVRACVLALGLVACPAPEGGSSHRILMTAPGENALDVSPDLPVVTVLFDTEMDPTAGRVVLEGGPGALGQPRWNLMGIQADVPVVERLAPDTHYELRFEGFRTMAGETVGRSAFLGDDDDLDFITGVGVPKRPVVVASTPAEGASDLPRELPSIRVVFDRPMPTAQPAAVLGGCPGATLGEAAWSADALTVTWPVQGRLPPGATCTLDGLRAFEDADGLQLDPLPLLVDGRLDFSIAAARVPMLLRSVPEAGSTGVAVDLDTLVLVFDAPMEVAAGAVRIGGGEGRAGRPRWNDAHTTAAVPVEGPLEGRTMYDIMLDGFRDAEGTALPTTVLGWVTGDAEPGVSSVVPRSGATGVDPGLAAIVVTFAQPMDPAQGVWRLTRASGELLAIAGDGPSWNDASTVVTLVPLERPLAPASSFALRAEGLRTSDGRTIGGSGQGVLSSTFRTAGTVRPRLLSTEPGVGAVNVVSNSEEISLVFDAPMDPGDGLVTLTDPAGEAVPLDLARAAWTATHRPSDTFTVPRTDAATQPLADRTTYAVTLSGFRDDSGTPLDADSGGLVDARFTFTTRPDRTPPRLSLQVATFQDGNPGRLELTFDERLAADGITATITGDVPTPDGISPVTTGPIVREEAATGTRLTIPVSSGLRGFRGPLVPGTYYTVAVDGLRDPEGNLLGATGRHVFTTTGRAETVRPYIRASSPGWGGAVNGHDPGAVVLTFTRSMHRMDGLIRAPKLVGGDPAYAFGPPLWSDDNTKATYPIVRSRDPAGPSVLRMKHHAGEGPDYFDAGGRSALNYATDPSAWQVGCVYYEELEFEATW